MSMTSAFAMVNGAVEDLAGPVLFLSLVLLLLWTFLPFAVFGIKRRLDRSIELQERIVRELAGRREALEGTDRAHRHTQG